MTSFALKFDACNAQVSRMSSPVLNQSEKLTNMGYKLKQIIYSVKKGGNNQYLMTILNSEVHEIIKKLCKFACKSQCRKNREKLVFSLYFHFRRVRAYSYLSNKGRLEFFIKFFYYSKPRSSSPLFRSKRIMLDVVGDRSPFFHIGRYR